MNEEKGFIKIYRSLIDWEWWGDHNTLILFLYCLLAANWKDKSWQGNKIKRGQFVTSLPDLAQKTGLSIHKVRTALDHLILTGNLAVKTCSKFRIITVKNYDSYQADGSQDGSQTADRWQTSGRQVAITKERKKERREEREEGGARAREKTPPPHPDDDILFLGEYGNVRMTAEQLQELNDRFPSQASRVVSRLSSYMAENGKTYDNHFAVLCRWASEDEERDRKKAKDEASRRTYDIEAFEDIDFDFEREMERLRQHD